MRRPGITDQHPIGGTRRITTGGIHHDPPAYRFLLPAGAAAAATTTAAVLVALGTGRAQAASSNLFASVSLSGTLVAGNGVSRVTHIGTGQYEVTFTSNVSGCAYVATTINAYSQALQVFAAGGHLSSAGVYVETKNQADASVNGGGQVDHLPPDAGDQSDGIGLSTAGFTMAARPGPLV